MPSEQYDFVGIMVSPALDASIFSYVVMWDMSWAVLSILVVILYMTCHLRSFFLAWVGMSLILLSIPIAVIIAKLFRVHYFQQLHVLLMFVLIGIGCHNVFVFVDAWRQSE